MLCFPGTMYLLDTPTVMGIAFAAFVIGVLLTGALWFIYSHTGRSFTCCFSALMFLSGILKQRNVPEFQGQQCDCQTSCG